MDPITIILYIAVFGLIAWAITRFIPMPEPFKVAIYVFSGIVLLIWLIQISRSHLPTPHVG